MKRTFRVLGGFLAGVANGLLGAGGGMVIVPRLNRMLLRRLFGALMLWAAWRMLF